MVHTRRHEHVWVHWHGQLRRWRHRIRMLRHSAVHAAYFRVVGGEAQSRRGSGIVASLHVPGIRPTPAAAHRAVLRRKRHCRPMCCWQALHRVLGGPGCILPKGVARGSRLQPSGNKCGAFESHQRGCRRSRRRSKRVDNGRGRGVAQVNEAADWFARCRGGCGCSGLPARAPSEHLGGCHRGSLSGARAGGPAGPSKHTRGGNALHMWCCLVPYNLHNATHRECIHQSSSHVHNCMYTHYVHTRLIMVPVNGGQLFNLVSMRQPDGLPGGRTPGPCSCCRWPPVRWWSGELPREWRSCQGLPWWSQSSAWNVVGDDGDDDGDNLGVHTQDATNK